MKFFLQDLQKTRFFKEFLDKKNFWKHFYSFYKSIHAQLKIFLNVKIIKKRVNFLSLVLVFFLFVHTAFSQESVNKKPLIIASINPIYQILLAITQDEKNGLLLIDPSISEHFYRLKKSDVEFFSKADLVFYVDDDLEQNFSKLIKNFAAEKKSYKLSTLNNIKLLPRRNNPKKVDVHLWLNPKNMTKIAEFMTQKISEIDSVNAQNYQKNLEKFKLELAETEKTIITELSKLRGSNYVFYHDGYQYFEDYFNFSPLKILSFDHEQELGIKEAREFDSLAKSGRVKCIFGEVRDDKNSAMKLAINYHLKFIALDGLGSKEKLEENGSNKNGYSRLLINLTTSLAGCSS